MDAKAELLALHEQWARRAARRSAGSDLTRSIEYFLTETGLNEPRRTPRRIANWLAKLSALENFVRREGRSPRRNARQSRTQVDSGEERLANWVRQQRRSAATLCEYQRARLECVPGFSWAPKEDAWNDQFERHREFAATAGHAPSLRSHDQIERRLASWARTQGSRYREGKLEKHRVDELISIPYWRWRLRRQ